MVARSWHRDWLEEILGSQAEDHPELLATPYLCIPLMSIVRIARECGWRHSDSAPACVDPCVVCLERKCTVAAEGCDHEFCTQCALYLCSTNSNSTAAHDPPGSIACPLCRCRIVSFVKLPVTSKPVVKEIARTSLSLSFCSCSAEGTETSTSRETPFCKPDFHCTRISPLGCSFRSLSCQKFASMRLNSGLCMGAPEVSPCLVPGNSVDDRRFGRCSRSGFSRSTSHGSESSGRSWFSSLSINT